MQTEVAQLASLSVRDYVACVISHFGCRSQTGCPTAAGRASSEAVQPAHTLTLSRQNGSVTPSTKKVAVNRTNALKCKNKNYLHRRVSCL